MDNFVYAQWLFTRLIGIIYLIAFISLLVQAKGLYGKNGVLPIRNLLESMKSRKKYYYYPSLLWLGSSDLLIIFWLAIGSIASLLILADMFSAGMLLLAYLIYLSYTSVGQDFLSFQWDVLLLEAGFVALIWELFPTSIAIFLVWFLLFRFMIMSGIAKLQSNDKTWRNLTALQYHYETQPLPTKVGWYFHHLPKKFHKISAFMMFIVELVVPLLIFSPLRIAAFILLNMLQLLIMITGNYAAFNLLAISLSIPLLSDDMLKPLLDNFIQLQAKPAFLPETALYFFAAIIIGLGALQIIRMLTRNMFSHKILAIFSPFCIANSYGLFAVMTTERDEIVLEGSNDGKNWEEYGFKYKPWDVKSAPKLVQPHQPRLDWQMWFAALSMPYHNKWLLSLMEKMLQGNKDALLLLGKNPFEKPPKYLRALRYKYNFTTIKERKATGQWWKRELKGLYIPSVSLKD